MLLKKIGLLAVVVVASSSGSCCCCCWGFVLASSSAAASTAATTRRLQSPPSATKAEETTTVTTLQQPYGNILILDHLNINHEKGRHDWLKAFYFDFLQCAVDPRKEENLETGTNTLWANIGAHQFHLPEGKPDAQVLNGVITLAFPDLAAVQARYSAAREQLEGSLFDMVVKQQNDDDDSNNEEMLVVTDPWGNQFHLVVSADQERDARGQQPRGDTSEGHAMRDLTIYTPAAADTTTPFAGIGRFYETVLGAPLLHVDESKCVVSVGPLQTLTFCSPPPTAASSSWNVNLHADLRQEGDDDSQQQPPSNYGPHISMYVADLAASYQKADALGLTYVNPRFKRRAYNLEQALDQCMFRCLDIVDPDNPQDGPLLKLEHEVRSVVKPDGSKYKSCPFDEIPAQCQQSS